MSNAVSLRQSGPGLAARFWAKVDKSPGHGSGGDCWVWTASKDTGGYGQIRIDGKLARAHRVAYETEYAAVPAGLLVCHHCDNRSCVRPAHMFLGSHQANMDDMGAKGRNQQPKGERHGNSKLCSSGVLAIRTEYAAGGVSQSELARRHGVTKTLIGYVVRGEIWKHVPLASGSHLEQSRNERIDPK